MWVCNHMFQILHTLHSHTYMLYMKSLLFSHAPRNLLNFQAWDLWVVLVQLSMRTDVSKDGYEISYKEMPQWDSWNPFDFIWFHFMVSECFIHWNVFDKSSVHLTFALRESKMEILWRNLHFFTVDSEQQRNWHQWTCSRFKCFQMPMAAMCSGHSDEERTTPKLANPKLIDAFDDSGFVSAWSRWR